MLIDGRNNTSHRLWKFSDCNCSVFPIDGMNWVYKTYKFLLRVHFGTNQTQKLPVSYPKSGWYWLVIPHHHPLKMNMFWSESQASSVYIIASQLFRTSSRLSYSCLRDGWWCIVACHKSLYYLVRYLLKYHVIVPISWWERRQEWSYT